jgi:hypothetical protein
MALYEDEPCGLARVTSDDRIVHVITRCGKPRGLPKPAPPGCPDASRQQQNAPGCERTPPGRDAALWPRLRASATGCRRRSRYYWRFLYRFDAIE